MSKYRQTEQFFFSFSDMPLFTLQYAAFQRLICGLLEANMPHFRTRFGQFYNTLTINAINNRARIYGVKPFCSEKEQYQTCRHQLTNTAYHPRASGMWQSLCEYWLSSSNIQRVAIRLRTLPVILEHPACRDATPVRLPRGTEIDRGFTNARTLGGDAPEWRLYRMVAIRLRTLFVILGHPACGNPFANIGCHPRTSSV